MTLAALCLQQCHLPADVTFIARADPEFGYGNGISLCLGHDLQESRCCCSWAVSLHIPSQFLQEVQEIQSVLCLCSEDSCIWPVRPQAGKSTSCNEPCMKSWELELPSFNVVPPQRPKNIDQDSFLLLCTNFFVAFFISNQQMKGALRQYKRPWGITLKDNLRDLISWFYLVEPAVHGDFWRNHCYPRLK